MDAGKLRELVIPSLGIKTSLASYKLVDSGKTNVLAAMGGANSASAWRHDDGLGDTRERGHRENNHRREERGERMESGGPHYHMAFEGGKESLHFQRWLEDGFGSPLNLEAYLGGPLELIFR